MELRSNDKLLIFLGLALVSSVGWAYMFYMAWAMENMHIVEMWMPPRGGARAWTAYDFIMLVIMWMVMMIAMMTPTVTPMVTMFATVNKQKKLNQQLFVPTYIFLLGYLFAWVVFSVVISFIQWPLHESGLLNPMMNSRSYLLSGGILVIAGLYQWTPLKDVCLNNCRTPLGFVLASWKDGYWGAFNMGFKHGLFCVGCCWALMAILFSVGVMNMLWVILITLFVLFEKLSPLPVKWTRFISGLALIIWGGIWLSMYPW